MSSTTLHHENEVLRQRIAALEQHNATLARQAHELTDALQAAQREKALLEKTLKEALRRRTKLDVDAEGQMSLLFGEVSETVAAPPHVDEAPDGESTSDAIEKKHRTRRPARQLAYSALPREHVVHELPEHARGCETTGLPLVEIGETIFEEIDYTPARLTVIVHHRKVYGLSPEHAAERSAPNVTAALPPRAIEKSPASRSLLAWMLVQKYVHHLPLHRQEAIFAREGLLIPRQTQCDWVMACADLLGPIQAALRREILQSGIVQLDDTPVQCQQGRGQHKTQASLWVLLSPLVDGVVYDFLPGRGYEPVHELVGDLKGVLVGDGYAVHHKLANHSNGALVTAGCWSHVLRKFRDAIGESPHDATAMVAAIAMLFDIEKDADTQSLDPDARLALRRDRAPACLAEIDAQRLALTGRTSASGRLAEALTYLGNQWASLVRFLDDGRIPIHNNACERAIRPVAVGRRNWLFAGSLRGGRAAATVYSLVESCKLAGVDPYAYLADVLVRVRTHPARRVDELFPARWKHVFGPASAR